MATSYLLAQIIGIYFLVGGLAFVIHPALMREVMGDFARSRGLVFVSGMFTLLIAYLAVTFHSVWELSWRGMITLFAWVGVFKGIALILAPQSMLAIGDSWIAHPSVRKVYPFIMIALGLYLCVVGFVLL